MAGDWIDGVSGGGRRFLGMYNKDVHQNKKLDQFFTCESVATFCAKKLVPFRALEVIEPSAGNGVLVDVIKSILNPKKMTAFDLDPKRADIVKADFLHSQYKPKNITRTLIFW